MKAEHYLTSGLNRIPTSVAPISECVRHAIHPSLSEGPRPELSHSSHGGQTSAKTRQEGDCIILGKGLDSQGDFCIEGIAMVTDVPITYLGYVNRDTGVIEEAGHPLDGRAIEDKILIYPKGSGSTVAPYVLMGLLYEGKGPTAIVNRDVCTLTLPGCSLLNVPYGHGFEQDPCMLVNDGDSIRFERKGDSVSITVLERA
jgi:predicted aconitase with swiveling domain